MDRFTSFILFAALTLFAAGAPISSPRALGLSFLSVPSGCHDIKGETMSESKAEKGIKTMERLFGTATRESPLPGEFHRMTVEHLFGDVWQGPELAIEERSLLTCAVLVALGRDAEQRLHFQGARNLGIPRGRVEGMIAHVAHYAGWPVAVSAFHVLEEVWPATDGEGKLRQRARSRAAGNKGTIRKSVR